jgi:TRAP-type transport system periplasmic protein
MKRFRSSLTIVATVLAVAAAGAAQAQYQERSFRMANGVSKDHPMGNGVAKFNECTVARSGGKMKVLGFWDFALGADMPALQSTRTGTVDMVNLSTAPIASVAPVLGVFDLPFLFDSEKEADQLLDGKVGEWFSDKMPAAGVVNLAWWENGFRHMTNSKRPITRLEDFSGLKMRVMQNKIYIDTFTTLGTNAVPLAFSEIYSALETKTVDAQENPFLNIQNMKFYEVQKYLTLTKHTYSPNMILFSKKIWDTLSPQEQGTLKECAREGAVAQRKANREKEAVAVAFFKQNGLQVNEITPAEMQRIRDKTAGIRDQVIKMVGQEPVDMVTNELKRIRGK